MNKSVQYAKAVVFGDIVAPSQVRKACENSRMSQHSSISIKTDFHDFYQKNKEYFIFCKGNFIFL